MALKALVHAAHATSMSTDLNATFDSAGFAPHGTRSAAAPAPHTAVSLPAAGRRQWSLVQRMAVLLGAVLVPVLGAALAMNLRSTQDTLGAALTHHDTQTALALATLVAPVQQDSTNLQALATALVQRGGYREVMIRTGLGTQTLARNTVGEAAAPDAAPIWFSQIYPVQAQPGFAALTSLAAAGPTPGLVRVESSTRAAQAALWRSAQELTWRLLLLAAAAAAAAAVLLARWNRPLAQLRQQALAIGQSPWVQGPQAQEIGAPEEPALRDISLAFNAVLRRSGELFASQAEQLAHLQLRAHTDPVTGLALRQPFMGRLQDALSHGRTPAAGLLLIRVADLQAANHQHGHEATDRMLRVLADLLLTYVERVPGTMAGRLNGCDFALYLPVSGLAEETAQSIQAALQATPSARLPGVRFLFGGCESWGGTTASAALATADAALARAEGGETLVVLQPEPLLSAGAKAWHDCIAQALEGLPASPSEAARNRGAATGVRLASFPVLDEAGALVHYECPMRLQAEPQGEWLKAQIWLALARRSGLIHRVDWVALDLALTACAADQQARCIHVSLHSFANPEFAPGMLARLQAGGAQTRLLSIEWSESLDAQVDMRSTVRQAVAQWRALGVRIGVEHAGSTPKSLPGLREMGVDYVKVDARHVRGAATDSAVKHYAASLVGMIHGLGMSAMAQGIETEADLEALQALGFDAFTGPAVRARHQGEIAAQAVPAQASVQSVADVQSRAQAQADTPASNGNLAHPAFVQGEDVANAVGEEMLEGLAHGAKSELVPRHFVFLEQPRLKGLRPWV
jgi:EAL domain-containing protein (putative c-di-GMP-specific phosphodiesterase class I)/GGDEF domain-containing protein